MKKLYDTYEPDSSSFTTGNGEGTNVIANLANAFKKELGQSISNFIEEMVMSEAQSQLLYSNRSIREISEALGYSDQFYFSRRFKKCFSTTPSKYRKR